jgi:NDP-sugar pyrophosphorylase family protein
MKYAIIAAGEGSRLAAEGISAPKPLVKVNGEALIDRLIRVFMDNDAEEIVVICRSADELLTDGSTETTQVASHLLALQRDGLRGRPLPLRFLVKSTPSSMHSFFEISEHLTSGPFVLTTVDTIFSEEEFSRYVATFQQLLSEGKADGLMGVTDYIDDEKPLYVKTDAVDNITAFLDTDPQPHYISAGIYGLTPRSIVTLNACMERKESRMRNFQRALVADGLHLKAYPFKKVLDIDHATDIGKAEAFLENSK